MAQVKNYLKISDFLEKDNLQLINWYAKIRHNINKESFSTEDIGNTCIYGDTFFDTYLIHKKKFIQEKCKKNLLPLSSIFNTYVNGSLEQIKIRNALYEVTCLINLGDDGASWPLIIGNDKQDEIDIKSGEALIFNGNLLKCGRKGFFNGDHMFILELNYCALTPYNENVRFEGRADLATPPLQT